MEIKEIKIKDGQFLQQVYNPIETNVILNKRLSGIGATHCEIIAPRNSIIVVPNIPIITCKVKKHKDSDNLFGVMQYVSVREIQEYLDQTIEKKKYIKIMVTPESFYKVRRAFDEIQFNMYESCFLMLDECHKFIKERDFRGEIIQPIPSFFKFKNKALVSATPLIPSDPRFEEQNFKLVKIVPPENKRFSLLLIETDDIERAFYDETRFYRQGNVPKEPWCIFVNSANIIAKLVIQLGMPEVTSIFCSEKSAVKLKYLGFKNIHTDWKPEYETKFMFFTSRFYTGLDIWLEKKPVVLYFSDAINAPQTLMDPFTDMAQACGRFRNGTKQIHHYVVFTHSNDSKTKEDIELEIKGQEEAYQVLQSLYNKTENPAQRKSILKIINSIPFHEMFTDNEIDYFLKDNYIDSEILKSIYSNYSTLMNAYGKSGYFKDLFEEEPHIYHFKGAELVKIKNFSTTKFKHAQREAIVETLKHIAPYRKTFEINKIINTLKSYDKITVDAYFKLGYDFIKQCDYNIIKIKDRLSDVKETDKFDESFYYVLLSTFEIGHRYLCKEAKKMLQHIYDKFNLTPTRTITSKSLAWFFEIEEVKIGNNRAIQIIRPTAEGLVNYFLRIKNNSHTERNDSFED